MYVHTLIRKFSRKKLTGLKLLFMYLGQKVHLFRPSGSRGLKQARTKGTFWQR
jgi:hypothetical protein